jgi:hypothetical protein
MALVSGGCCVARTAPGVAAAHVSGALALLLSIGVPAADAPGRLYGSAQNIGPSGWDASSGWGRLDVCRALHNSGRTCPAAAATPTRTATPAAASPACVDLNGDTWMDLGDVIIATGYFGARGSNIPADVTNDDTVDIEDQMMLLGCFGD